MNNYVLITDSASDLRPEMIKELGIKCIPLTFTFSDEEKTYDNYELPSSEFYQQMRNGRKAKTAAINVATFTEVFENELKEGNDILYVGFSSGLSTTYNSACIAAADLLSHYPERKIITIDALSASAGLGLLVYLTALEKKNGATIEQAAEFVNANKLSLAHWFTVDNLEYLKRGGRVSPTVAFVGGILGIKPILHVDYDGYLINMFTARGRKKSFEALANKALELYKNDGSPIWISHADCEDEAKELAKIVKSKLGKKVANVTEIGPVIGAHCGPGTIALYFLAKER